MARAIKSLVEQSLEAAGFSRMLRALRARDSLVLAFHNVIADDDPPGGDRPLHIPYREYCAYLDDLMTTHEIVTLAALRSPPTQRRRPRAAITFDDAYTGAVTLGAAALAERGLPATIFVAPGLLGAAACWWDTVTASGGIDPELKRWALDQQRGDPSAILAALPPDRLGGKAFPIADEAALSRATAHPGIQLAPHSWTHRNLARLEQEELRFELEAPLQWLRARFVDVEAAIAYPYGSTSPTVESAAAAAGYHWGFRADYGWLPRAPANRFDLRRFTVGAGTTLLGFRIRCAGYSPG